MKFSELWLREWINLNLNSVSLLNQITMTGLEVTHTEPVAGTFKNIIIGEIIKCDQCSNSNKLHMLKVNIGSGRLLNIFCENPNCYQGMKVVVATTYSSLSNNFKIKKEKLNDKFSEGMLCSFAELGIDANQNSIIELPLDAPVGIDIREYLKLDDTSIEVKITPNRADCLCIMGIARELSIFNHTHLNIPEILPIVETIDETLSIHINSPKACPRYLGRIIKKVNAIAPTPLWMNEKLRRSGIRPANTIVNITNYVLLELGQPICIFDKDQIKGGVVVRMAQEGETIIMPNGNEEKLGTDTLIISDYEKILAMGGIFINKNCRINKKTKNIFLECAFFSTLIISMCARRYNLHTAASYRYERGVDPNIQYKAMERVTGLLINICGGEAGPIIDITNEANLPRKDTIILHRKKLDRLVGHYITNSQINDILHRLNFEVIDHRDQWWVIPPSWRFDIEIEEDLIEEIVRIYGYNNIIGNSIQKNLKTKKNYYQSGVSLKRAKILLNDKGYQEVITYSFVNPKLQQLIHPNKKALILPKPISKEMSVMRISLWTGLLGVIIYNQNRQKNRIRIFEEGLCFVPDEKANLGIRQDLILAGAIIGNRYEEHWDLKKEKVDFYDMKGDLESILDLTGRLSEIKFCVETISALHPGQCAAIYLHNECIGFIGAVHPTLERQLNLNSRTIIFEIQWNKIANRKLPQIYEVSRFPENRRDITVIVDENLPVENILAACRKININQLINIKLFDVFYGKGISHGYKSLTISLIIQDKYRTLKEEEISTIVFKCKEMLKNRFQALLRE